MQGNGAVTLAPPRRADGSPVRLWAEAVLAGLAGLVASLAVLRPWRQPLGVPFDYENDATFYLTVAQAIRQHGWYLKNPSLGYPYGQEMHDLALGGDNANFLALWVLGRFADAATAVNLFFLLTIVTVAATAHVALRLLGVRRWLAMVLAVVYTLAPYHLIRRTPHLMLSSYALVPVAVLLALAVMSLAPPVVRSGRVPRLERSATTWWVLAACVGLGSTGSYYAAFAGLLIASGGIGAALARRWLRPLWSAAAMCSVIVVTTLVNTGPSIGYWVRHGTNPLVAQRLVQDTELYGLRIQQLFMPRLGHRNAEVASFAQRAFAGPIPSEPTQALGLIAAAGLAGLLVAVVLGLLARRAPEEGTRRQVVQQLGVLAVVALVTAPNSGLNYWLALAGLKQIRGWNRISVVIAFLAIVVVAYGVEWMVDRVTARRVAAGDLRVPRIVACVIATALLAVTWYDQTSPSDSVDRAGVRAAWDSDAEFFGSMDDALPTAAAVFGFPIMTFPEGGGIGRIGLYDGARGFLHAPDLRWSFGAMHGRHPAWPATLESQDPMATVAELRRAGFRAIVVDGFGYGDAGAELVARLAGVVAPSGTSPDGRYTWFDLGTE